MTTPGTTTTAASLDACAIGLVPLRWPDPTADPDGFLAQVAELGFQGIQSGAPTGDVAEERARLEANDVVVAETYLPIRCSSAGPMPGSDAEADAHLERLVALGGRMLVAAIDGSPERDVAAGRAHEAPGLSREGFRRLVTLLERLCDRAAEHGVRVAFHPHAGTYVETPDETERLLAATDPDALGLCLDTGHWIVGGGDPVAVVERHGRRVWHVHVKDVDPEVLAGLRRGEVASFTEAVERIVFSPLGSGTLDLDGTLARLAEVGFDGWLMVEQDSFEGSAVDAARWSRAALGAAIARRSEPIC